MSILQWNTELEEEEQQLEKNCRDVQWKVQEMVTKNTHLQELYNKVPCANTEMQEKQRQERSQKNEQSLLEELPMRHEELQAIHENEQQRNKDMHEKIKELQDKNDEKH